MRKLTKPTFDCGTVFLECISTLEDEDFLKRLQLCKQEIIDDALEYDNKARSNTLHTLDTKSAVAGVVSVDEMKKIYTQKFVPKSSPGRKYYDKLLAAPAHGRCPLCGQRIVSQLDHHLPKANYPSLAITPINLVPACSDCNKKKLAGIPQSSEQETLHPYYDDIENDCWLYAEVIQSNPVSFRFFVKAPSHWSLTLGKRVENHFETFDLADLYASHAASDLMDNDYQLRILFYDGGSESVRHQLLEMAESCKRNHVNSWKTAMYKALSENEWFYSAGVIQ